MLLANTCQKATSGPKSRQINAQNTQLNSRPSVHQWTWRVPSSFLTFYKTSRDKTQHLLPRLTCSFTQAFHLNFLTAEMFCQRCSQHIRFTMLFSQFPCKIGIACNHSNLISDVYKLFKCRCKLYSQEQLSRELTKNIYPALISGL